LRSSSPGFRHACRTFAEIQSVQADRPPRSNLAHAHDHPAPGMAFDGSARWQPGADRADGRGAQAADVPAARRHRLQGDRGRVSVGFADRFRFRPPADRRGPDSRRRHDPGADTVARRAHPAHVRIAARCTASDRASLQPDGTAVSSRRLRQGSRRYRRHRDHRCASLRRMRGEPGRDGLALRVLARDVHDDRARLRARDLRTRSR